MVLPKCNLLSSRPFLNFQDGYQDSPQQNTQEAQVTQNQEVHRQHDTQQQQQQQDKKEENELFEENVKDYNNNSSVIPEVESGQGRVQHVDFIPSFEKDNTKKIPTSPKHVRSTIELMICPPAPKKKKTIQVTKRRSHHDHQDERVFLDVYNEVESLFPPSLLADLSKKIKKARKTTPIL